MLSRNPDAVKKRRLRRRRSNGLIAPSVQFHEHEFAEALLISGRLNEAEALRRDQLVREAESILQQFIDRWRPRQP